MITNDTLEGKVTNTVERLMSPVYVPLLALGLCIQVVAVVLRAPDVALIGLGLGGLADLVTFNEHHPVRGRLRRSGLGLGQRVAVRALLLLAAAVGSGATTRAIDVYVLAVCLTVLVARVHQRSFDLILREEPALGMANLGNDLGLAQYLGRARSRRLAGIGLMFGFEITLALGVTLGLGSGAVGSLGYTVMLGSMLLQVGLTVVTVATARRFLRSDTVGEYRYGLRAELDRIAPKVIVYFSGDQDATYQLNQWMPVFERLDQPVLYVMRERIHLRQMMETEHPVIYARGHREVEDAIIPSAQVALYVGNAGRNIHFLRYAQLKHVFLNHGDSDKASSANPFVRAYDKLFVAGPLAIQRYRDGGVPIPDDRFEIVGRPQLDRVLDRGRKIDDGPTTLLYAPTWEGYFEATNYSSLERMGPAMIEEVLASHPGIRIVFKPHPMSGLVRRGMRSASLQVEQLLRRAGSPHVIAADHPELDLLSWFDRSDVLLSDVSAVVTDWLHTDKPYVITNPGGLTRKDFLTHFPSHGGAYLVGPTVLGLGELIVDALDTDPLAAYRSETKRSVLGEHPNGPQESFEKALTRVHREADRDLAQRRGSFAHDS